jgi:hypothetical protein
VIVAERILAAVRPASMPSKRCAARKVGAIIAKSFARIFYRNAINLGIPLIISPEAVDALADGDSVEINLANGKLTAEMIPLTYRLCQTLPSRSSMPAVWLPTCARMAVFRGKHELTSALCHRG